MIGYFLGSDQVGIYSASYTLGYLIYFIYSPISSIFLPTITQLYDRNQKDKLIVYLKCILKIYLFLAIPSLFGLTVFAKPILLILTTNEISEGYLLVPIIAIGSLLFSIGIFFSDILILFKKTKITSYIFGTAAIINLILNFILIPMIGILGAAIATVLTFFILSSFFVLISYKYLAIKIEKSFVLKAAISSFIMSLFLIMINPTTLIDIIISISMGIIVYFCLFIMLKGFTYEELLYLKNFLIKNESDSYS
ncbi:MAG: hypothetical protein STSR0001_06520 [Methanothrix sp.]